jgi:mannose-6-phosphate isomerase-like protein (cupin superfamily)
MKIEKNEAENFEVDGIEIHKYVNGTDDNPSDVLHVSVDEEHKREFSNSESHFIYYVIKGKGKFWVDGEEIRVKPTDIVHIKPESKIYYRGDMEMILVTTPPYNQSNDTYYGLGREKY